jgi:hypothetical protein
LGEGRQVRHTLVNEKENVPMQFDKLSKILEGKEDASKKGYPIVNLIGINLRTMPHHKRLWVT